MSGMVSSLLHFFESLGYWGIMLSLMIEVIPSEIPLAYAGYLISAGKLSFIGAVIFGSIGGVLAQLFLYWIGRYGGRPILDRYGKYIMIKPKHIDLADNWVKRYGTGVIFTARFIPVVRHAISIPAGITKMSHARFLILTTLAVIPWSMLFIYLGMKLGENWEQINQKAGPYTHYAIFAAVGLLALYLIFKLLTRSKRSK
jgi:membrane protein DedA with SNARE-associated domain